MGANSIQCGKKTHFINIFTILRMIWGANLQFLCNCLIFFSFDLILFHRREEKIYAKMVPYPTRIQKSKKPYTRESHFCVFHLTLPMYIICDSLQSLPETFIWTEEICAIKHTKLKWLQNKKKKEIQYLNRFSNFFIFRCFSPNIFWMRTLLWWMDI